MGEVGQTFSQDYWSTRYDAGVDAVTWQLGDINPSLLKHYSLLTNGRKNLRIFLPLSGKTKDLYFLYNEGHTVVGVEYVQKAVEEFFLEEKLSFTVEEKTPEVKVYKTPDGRLEQWQCDFFKLDASLLGQFDAIWDRGSLVAIGAVEREPYAKLIKSVLKPDGVYLLNAFEYDTTGKFKGPPNNVPLSEINELYGDVYSIEHLDDAPLELKNDIVFQYGLESQVLKMSNYVLRRK